ncbi:sce7726 family protein [Tatumella sp. OPLPL6]|uniref:sce7726 family protein n=1 Tax=Tatumella sp. OPLPL6 TaxID=1928657 RepID=UPI000C19C31A|nr:sce7726 family protein [Tatumella sp. OPLPL6]
MILAEKEMCEHRAIAQLFTSQAISKIAEGNLTLIHKILEENLRPQSFPLKVENVFELALKTLLKNYKNEYIFKNTIINKILCKKNKKSSTTILSEFRVGDNKADLVIVNGHSVCYEIKTRYDSLKRLPDQLSSYTKIFDKVYVVCDEYFKDEILNIIPSNVGVFEFTHRGALREIKKAKVNIQPISYETMIDSLRMEEYKFIAECLTTRKVESRNIHIFNDCLEIFKESDPEKLRKYFRESLKKFRGLDIDYISSVPNSLVNSAISYRMPKTKRNSLLEILKLDIYKENICTSRS